MRRTPGFFGWSVTAAAAAVMGATIPGQTAGVSLFIDLLIRDVGVGRQTVSTVYALATVAAALVLPWSGRAMDRWGPRRGALIAGAGLALACAFMGSVGGLVTLAVGFFLLRALGQGALALSAIHVVNLWFVRRRGVAVGLMGVGMAVAVALVPPLIERGIDGLGWRWTYALLGAGVLTVVAPAAGLFFRHRPERYGLLPDGLPAPPPGARPEPSATLAQARRARAFWIVTAGIASMNCLGTAYLFHHVDLMASQNVGRDVAAVMFTAYGLVNAAASLAAGVLIDRWGPRLVLAAALGLFAAVTAGLPLVASAAGVILYGVAFGVSQAMQSNISGSAFAHYFGRDHIGAIKGFTRTAFVAATATGPPLLPFVASLTGGYAPALWLLAVVPAGLGVWAWLGLPRRT